MKKLIAIFTVLVMTMLTAICMPVSAAVQNLIKANEETILSIENDAYPPTMAGWNGTKWGTWVQASDKAVDEKWVSIDTATKKFGSKSFKIDTKDSSTNATIIYPMSGTTLTKGSTYTVTGYIKTSGVTSPTDGADILVRFLTTANNTSIASGEFTTTPITGTVDWKKVYITFKVPTATFDQIQIQLRMWGPAKGVAYFDGVSLTSGSTVPTDYNALTNPGGTAVTTTATPTTITTTTVVPTTTTTTTANPATGTTTGRTWLILLALAAVAAIIGIVYAVRRTDDHDRKDTDPDKYKKDR